MLAEGIHPIGDGLLEVAEERLKGLLVPDDINEIYDVEQAPFARGKFAAVRRAVHKKSGVHFAAKFLKRRRRAQSSDKEIKHEIAVLMLCSGSDSIVKLNAVHETRSDTALLLELATGGELQTFLDNEGSLTEAKTRICMKEILKAIQFLHKRSIAHLDLKPQNILLTGSRIEDGLKLCDFGISRVIENGSKVREILGTPDYVAPEVLQYEPLSLQTDIWSVGVLTYVLLSGYTPFGGDTKQETFLNISQCSLSFPEDLFEGVSQHAIDFIKSTLRIKPNDRMTAFECLEHIWLKDESPISRTSLNISVASDDIFNKQQGTRESSTSTIIKSNGCQSYKQGIVETNKTTTTTTTNGATNGDTLKHTTHKNTQNSSNDNDEYDKENFLINSSTSNTNTTTPTTANNTTTTTTNNISNISSSITTSATIGNFSSYSKLTNSILSKYCNNKPQQYQQQIRSGNCCTLVKNHQQNECEIEILHSGLEKTNSRSMITKCASSIISTAPTGTGTGTATVAVGITTSTGITKQQITSSSSYNNCSNNNNNNMNKVNLCLFPDAPTTPKVIRKAPSESPTSVKALVKKFQLENGGSSISNGISGEPLSPVQLKDNNHHNHHHQHHHHHHHHRSHHNVEETNNKSGCEEKAERMKFISRNLSSSSNKSSNNSNNSCVFCLSCGRLGCRHSGNSVVGSKSSSNLGLDQGIIC